ncbi:MAG: hypothetical protein ACRDTH_24115 [Pseudonocardiaceae bacterium]
MQWPVVGVDTGERVEHTHLDGTSRDDGGGSEVQSSFVVPQQGGPRGTEAGDGRRAIDRLRPAQQRRKDVGGVPLVE